MYWAVRTGVILRNTGELPIEISGPDAERLLNAGSDFDGSTTPFDAGLGPSSIPTNPTSSAVRRS